MSYSTIIAAIKALVQSASVAAQVYDYDVIGDSGTEWGDLLRNDDGLINAICIDRRSISEDFGDMIALNDVTEQYTFKWYYAISSNGASKKTFQGLIDTLRATIRADKNLSGACNDHNPLQFGEIADRQFGETLVCHYAEGTLEVLSRATR